jgi:hypothetical protein
MCSHQFVQVVLDIEAKCAWVQCAECRKRLVEYQVVADWKAQTFVISPRASVSDE